MPTLDSIPLDDEDAFRLAYAQAAAHEAAAGLFALRMRALGAIDRHRLLPQHRAFVRHVAAMPPEQMTARQREHAERLAWIYRRNLPAHLAPKVNPDDPIVREQRAKELAHA